MLLFDAGKCFVVSKAFNVEKNVGSDVFVWIANAKHAVHVLDAISLRNDNALSLGGDREQESKKWGE